MKHSIRWLDGLLLGLFLFSARGDGAEPTIAKTGATQTNSAWQIQVPTFIADAIPLESIAELLQKQFANVNFVVADDARQAAVTLKLRSVKLEDILKAIELSSQGRIRAFRQSDNLVGFSITRPAVRKSPPVCRVFSLAPYLAGRSDEEAHRNLQQLYDALDTAWAMLAQTVPPEDGGFQRPQLQIHPGTKLLIVVGREKELSVIEQIVKELQGSASSKTIPAPAENEAKPKTAGTNSVVPGGRR